MKALKTAAAGLLVLLLVIAPPYLLTRFIGNPYPPEGLDLAAPLTDNAVLGLIAVLVWVLWAQFTLSMIVEGYAALTDRAVAVRIPVFEIQQDLARALIAAVITTAVVAPLSIGAHDPGEAADSRSTSATPTGTSSTSNPSTRAQHGSAHLQRHKGGHQARRQAAAADSTADPAEREQSTVTAPASAPEKQATQRITGSNTGSTTGTITVTAQRGDSLWSLAETYLGDGDRWSEIAAANSGATMTDGVMFSSANQIRAGWHIAIPGVPKAVHDDQTGHAEHYRVEPGDTLSDIAEDKLGDASRFPEIFTASRSTTQPDGQHLRDPDVIDVGWTVTIPRQARPRSGVPDHPAGRAGDRAEATEGREGTPDDSTHPSSSSRTPPPDTTPQQSPPTATPHGSAPETDTPQAVTPKPGEPREPPESTQPPSATSAPATPSTTQSPEVDRGGDRNAAEGKPAQDQAPWAAMTGAGVLLAGGLMLGLRARRRAQLRVRRPGRAIAAPSRNPSLVETSIAANTGAPATVEHLDAALRRLAAWSAHERKPMPTLAAVEMTDDALVLHLTAPTNLPAPWHDPAGDQLHWRAPAMQASSEDIDPSESASNEQASEHTNHPHYADDTNGADDTVGVTAPYPLLVTVGSTDAGAVWLLNFEELGEVRITGDADRGRAFARYLVAELAMNPWSEQARVDCVAIAAEVAPMNPDRVDHHAAGNLAEIADAVLADAVITVDRADAANGGPVTGRTGQLDDDAWPARMVVVDSTQSLSQPDQGSLGRHALQQLGDLIGSHPGRTGTAVILVGDDEPSTSTQVPTHSGRGAVEIRVDQDARLSVASVGLELLAVGLSTEEAHGCAALLTQSEDLDDVEIPVDNTADISNIAETAVDGWEGYVDTSGALRREHTVPRSRPAEELSEPVGSLLDAPTEAYLRAAAATRDDLELLAPSVPVRLRAEIEAKDPSLDQDVADWFDDSCRRPRLVLLGPVTARGYGRPLAKQKPYMAELLAYLASRRRTGVTPAQVASTFGITTNKAHSYTEILRAWLGINPRTGRPYLPHATKAPSARVSGVGVYQLDQDVLVDRELFLRLRARGQARNAEGITDLQRALSLVSGRPFDQLRTGGWEWLPPLEPLDVSSAIADVAFLVTTRCLERGEVEQARTAADVAILVAPDSEAARLSLAAVVEAEGDRAGAERIVREEICNRSDDHNPPTELSERTQAIIDNREWLTRGRKTS